MKILCSFLYNARISSLFMVKYSNRVIKTENKYMGSDLYEQENSNYFCSDNFFKCIFC